MGLDIIKTLTEEQAMVKAEIESGVPSEIMAIITASRLDLTKENPDPEAILLCIGLHFATLCNFSVNIVFPGSS